MPPSSRTGAFYCPGVTRTQGVLRHPDYAGGAQGMQKGRHRTVTALLRLLAAA